MFTNQNKHTKHNFFMKLALNQAQKNLGNTKTNPSVGCVIAKNNSLISAGCTGVNGTPHAETNAINNSKVNLKNSYIYITLEPCSHFGKTPPCTNLIIKNKIKKVFFSINDADIRSKNKSKKIFNKRQISVKKGLNFNEIKYFYRSYLKFKNSNLPFVTAKLAVSKDFFTVNKKKRWITNNFSRARVQLMRSMHDCLITSSNTVIKDNPRLTCRIDGLNKFSPARVILDNKLKVPVNSTLIKEAYKYNTIIFYNKYIPKKIKLLKKLKVKTFQIPLNENNDLNLKKTLAKTKKLGFSRIFVEAGVKLTSSFLQENLVNDFKLYISNERLNYLGKQSIKKYFKLFLKNKKKVHEKVNLFGEKIISYIIK